MSSQANREIEIFNSALEQTTPAERAAYLDGACGADAELRARVEALIRAHEEAGGFLPTEGVQPQPAAPAKTLVMTTGMFPVTEKVGDRIGHYKLREKIGEGGCGVVYVADQETPVRRRVALKVIKLGMDTKAVIARFEAERQALAMMDHPNIAKVLDAGATDAGRPYFVMELVRGIKITDYCDQNKLTTRERLVLFIQVCQAIQHAHQKGIIHRDIKPSNILVTLHDGVPVPKIIDFGISKATEGRLTELTVYTELHQFIGTPAYMSPEQAEMSGLDIDTRTDIYSLGVLLYELLTGGTPFDPKDLLKSGLDEMRKTIRESDPPRPSTRLSTMLDADLTAIALRHGAESPKLIHLVRGDLDWIVMKSLEKDRTRRYDTANGLAMDIQRHLSDEPVVARPPGKFYLFQKMVRRNKPAFAAAGAVVAALVVGLSLAAIEWHQTRVERDKALEARAAALASEKKAITAEAGQTRLREQSEAQALTARRTAYNSDMNLVQQALAANNFARAQELLNRQRPQPGQLDLRGWEWRYLWSQARADDHEVFFAGTNRSFRPLSFSADGRLLAWGQRDDDETVVSDLISHRTVLQRKNAWHPVFAHHGARLAFVDSQHFTNHSSIALLDMATQEETWLETPWKDYFWFCFTPDDRQILTVSYPAEADHTTTDGVPLNLTAWDVNNGRQLWQRAIRAELETPWGRRFVISPDGTAFAAVVSHDRVQVLDTKDGSERFTIKTTEDYTALAVAFSPDSSTLLTSAGFRDSAIRLWDGHSGKAGGSLEGHSSYVSDLLFTPDGKRLISSSGDQTIRLWDWSTRKQAGVLRGHLDEVDSLALAPDGQTLASRCKDGSIYLWDLTKPSRHAGYQTLPSRVIPYDAVFTTNSQSILGVQLDGGVAFWDALTVKETQRFWGNSTNRNISVSPDARWALRMDRPGHFGAWDVRNGLERTNVTVAHEPLLYGTFTYDGRFGVALSGPETNAVIEAWDTDTLQRTASPSINVEGFQGIFAPSSPNSLVILVNGAFHFIDVTKLNEVPKQIKRPGIPVGLGTSPDGRIAATRLTFDGGLNALASSPDGQTVAVVYDEGIVLWDMATMQPVDILKGFLLAAHSVAYSPDGRRLAVGSDGSEAVKLWDTETRQEVLTLGAEGSLFESLRFSPDGRHLLAITASGVADLWSAPTWEEIAAAEAKEKTESKQP